jgi:hypothetical protein
MPIGAVTEVSNAARRDHAFPIEGTVDAAAMTHDLATIELEALVRRAVDVGDTEGVQSAVVALATSDPARAAELFDELHLNLDLTAARPHPVTRP